MDTILLVIQIMGYILGFLSIVMGFIATLRIIFLHPVQRGSYITGPLFFILGSVVILSAHILIPKLQTEKEQAEIQKEQEKVHLEQAMNEYTWYLDGKEINPKTISVDDYKITYNDSDKIVTLSIAESKEEDETTASMVCLIMIFIIFLWSFSSVSTRNGG